MSNANRQRLRENDPYQKWRSREDRQRWPRIRHTFVDTHSTPRAVAIVCAALPVQAARLPREKRLTPPWGRCAGTFVVDASIDHFAYCVDRADEDDARRAMIDAHGCSSRRLRMQRAIERHASECGQRGRLHARKRRVVVLPRRARGDCLERWAGNETAQVAQAAEGAKRHEAGKAIHGVSQTCSDGVQSQNSVERIRPTAMPSSAKSALSAATKMFS